MWAIVGGSGFEKFDKVTVLETLDISTPFGKPSGPIVKAIQSYIWQQGFEEGRFKGHVYEDAYLNLVRWHQAGISLY